MKIEDWGRNCASGGTEIANPLLNRDLFISSDTPGASAFQYYGAKNRHPTQGACRWQLNWTAPPQPGPCWNVYIGSRMTGQFTAVARLQLK